MTLDDLPPTFRAHYGRLLEADPAHWGPVVERVLAHWPGPVPVEGEARGPAAAPAPALPPLGRRALNLAAAVAAHLAGGGRITDDATRRARLATCAGCDRFRPVDRRCAECGCFVDAKAAWATEHCPLSKWPGDPR